MLCSKFVKQGWKCKTNEDAISILLNDFKGDGEKALLISCSDDATAMLDKHYDELKDRFILPLTSFHGHQEELMSKQYMSNLALNIGMNVPETWLLKKIKKYQRISFIHVLRKQYQVLLELRLIISGSAMTIKS